MPIVFECACGKTLKVPDEHAGRRVKCPACNNIGFVPGGQEHEFEVVEDVSKAPAAASPTALQKPYAKPTHEEDEDVDRGYSVDRDDDDDDDNRRRRRRRRPYRRPRRPRAAPPRQNTGRQILYIVGGVLLLMLGIGAVIMGLLGDGHRPIRAVVFGICLFISGIGTMTRGLTGSFDDE